MKKQLFPALDWLGSYSSALLSADSVAALVVTMMLIPQALAYAMLAGVPPEIGLYASILPLIAYALFGSSRTLSVGPVAIVSLMTASAVGQLAESGSVEYLHAVIALALLSGVMLLVMGFLRLGVLANLLSHPVVLGFITAASVLIILGQMKYILGVEVSGGSAINQIASLLKQVPVTNGYTLLLGAFVLALLVWTRTGLQPLLEALGVRQQFASRLSKAGPVLAMILTTLAAWFFELDRHAVALVGEVPSGLPKISIPSFDATQWRELIVAALLISVIGYVESVSLAKTLAAKRRQRIDPDQELIGLGAANVASAMSGGLPVAGGFARSVVNFDSGAATQMAGILAAVGIGLAAMFLTPYLAFLPKATLAATIIIPLFSLIDISSITRAWRYSKTDFAAILTTIIVTLVFGIETGLACGVAASIALHLYKTSQPHIAIVGEVQGTEHFRNIDRHDVITCPHIVTLRVDESLYFVNASFVEDRIYSIVANDTRIKHIILMCTAINEIDLSAFEVLEAVNDRLDEVGVTLHLSEVKGPVMDFLQKTAFLKHLRGNIYLSQHQALNDLDPEGTRFHRAAAN